MRKNLCSSDAAVFQRRRRSARKQHVSWCFPNGLASPFVSPHRGARSRRGHKQTPPETSKPSHSGCRFKQSAGRNLQVRFWFSVQPGVLASRARKPPQCRRWGSASPPSCTALGVRQGRLAARRPPSENSVGPAASGRGRAVPDPVPTSARSTRALKRRRQAPPTGAAAPAPLPGMRVQGTEAVPPQHSAPAWALDRSLLVLWGVCLLFVCFLPMHFKLLLCDYFCRI